MPVATCNGSHKLVSLSGRDTFVHATHGPAHTHTCAWCWGNILCVNGPDCDLEDGEMHCTGECYRHEGAEGRAAGTLVG